MQYDDNQLLSISEYEAMAKAYASELKKRGFMVVQINDELNSQLLQQVFDDLLQIKSFLFSLGGFLNTSAFYSLNERQIKKLSILLDFSPAISLEKVPRDKTKCFLAFLSREMHLIRLLIEFSEQSNYETEIKKIIDARLSLLSQLLKF